MQNLVCNEPCRKFGAEGELNDGDLVLECVACQDIGVSVFHRFAPH